MAESTPSPTSAPSPAPTFLDTGGCAAREGAANSPAFLEVSCTSERAAARVLVRRAGAVVAGAAVDCPLATDFVLYLSEGGPGRSGLRLHAEP
ncbi:hypothetical protein [Streptomyces xanthochromogenes]|uniref:hypothetical protein n=1 Tax=Streptomyces xanthochromogenes TaxID=67384 RepID=UPI0039C89AAE